MFRRVVASRVGTGFAALMLLTLMSGSVRALEDPTRPPGRTLDTTRVQIATPVLSYVLFGAGRRVAQINGHVMQEGHTVAGIHLQQIMADAVIVRIGGGAPRRLSLSSLKVHKEIK